jgi:hypothetical protein
MEPRSTASVLFFADRNALTAETYEQCHHHSTTLHAELAAQEPQSLR